jgi:prevent-host-death family protein
MSVRSRLGIEQARARLPSLIADAHDGRVSVVTKHGKPYAAIVPVEMASARRGSGVLDLRGSGKGLWSGAGRAVESLRSEWD